MRKGKPLQRRTGLKTNTPLRATKPMKRSAASVPGKSSVNPIKPRRPTVTAEERHGRKVVQARSLVGDARVCEIALPGVCTGRATEWHHRLNRSQAGTWAPANGLDACHNCHAMVTDTRPEYYDAGWCVKSWEDPRTKPVLYRGRMVLLDNEGTINPSPAPGKAAA